MKTKEKVSGAAGNVKPYVERALQDDELRTNVKNAFDAAREIYDELMAPRGVTTLATKVATDKDIQDNLRTAVEELRSAAGRLQGKQETHKGRNTMLLLTGIALGVLFNPITGAETRKWLRETILGGGEDDFSYQGPGSGNSSGGTSSGMSGSSSGSTSGSSSSSSSGSSDDS